MKTCKLYLDTSVFGGYFDKEFSELTQKLWKLMEQGRYHFVSSGVAAGEIAFAPDKVKVLFAETFQDEADIIDLTDEAEELAKLYLKHEVVSKRYEDDAYHVAVCTVSKIDYLVSWNFKHLVNVHRESGFNGVNLLQEYPTVRIISPKELVYGIEK